MKASFIDTIYVAFEEGVDYDGCVLDFADFLVKRGYKKFPSYDEDNETICDVLRDFVSPPSFNPYNKTLDDFLDGDDKVELLVEYFSEDNGERFRVFFQSLLEGRTLEWEDWELMSDEEREDWDDDPFLYFDGDSGLFGGCEDELMSYVKDNSEEKLLTLVNAVYEMNK